MVGDNNSKIKHTLTGEVISDKMNKTIVVKVTRAVPHSLLHKVLHVAKKYKVHDETQQAKVGDIVEIYSGKPTSKTKYMYLSRVIRSQAS